MTKLKNINKENFKVQSFYSKEYENYDMPLHSHQYIELMYVTHGKGTVIVQKNNAEQEITLCAQQFIILDSEVFHKLSVDSKSTIINIELKPTILPYSCCLPFSSLKENSQTLTEFIASFDSFAVFEDVANVNKIMRQFYSEYLKNEYNDTHVSTQSLINLLFIYIARCKDHPLFSNGTHYYNKALKYINEHIDEHISIDEIASYVRINKAHLHRLFKKHSDYTLINYINFLKIERAKKLLQNTTMPLIDIAVSLGFNNRQNFFYSFKKNTGISPQAYRNDIQKQSFEVYTGIYQHNMKL